MRPVEQDLEVYQGDTFEFFFRLRSKVYDEATNTYIPGAYINLTNYVGKAQVRANEDSTQVLAEFTVAISNQSTVPGGVLLTLTAAQTKAIPGTGGRWDVQLTNPSAEVQTYIRGAVNVTKEVTRA